MDHIRDFKLWATGTSKTAVTPAGGGNFLSGVKPGQGDKVIERIKAKFKGKKFADYDTCVDEVRIAYMDFDRAFWQAVRASSRYWDLSNKHSQGHEKQRPDPTGDEVDGYEGQFPGLGDSWEGTNDNYPRYIEGGEAITGPDRRRKRN